VSDRSTVRLKSLVLLGMAGIVDPVACEGEERPAWWAEDIGVCGDANCVD